MAAKTSGQLPWDQAKLSQSEISAIKAIADGVAEPEQQRLAFRTIVHKLCNAHGMSFTILGPDEGKRATDFSEGKRWVGNTLLNDIVGREYPVNPRGAPPPMPAAETAVSESSQQGET